jgi:tRNA(Ile)-lysidine synthase
LRKNSFAEKLENEFVQALEMQSWMRPGLKLAIAVSGGADSVALLHLALSARAKLGLALSAVHFNHHLRGKASNADERFVGALAANLEVPLQIGRADVGKNVISEKTNLEDTARRARYEFFRQLVERGVLDLVATAHSMDDQAETVMAHILRGTGIAGLAAIHPVTNGIVRPLLGFRRDDLRKYLRSRKQRWREDATNLDLARNRARMRKKLFPLLTKQFNPAVVEHLAALADRAREQNSLSEHLTARILRTDVKSGEGFARIALRELRHPLGIEEPAAASVLQARLVQELAAQVQQRHGQILATHVASVMNLAINGEPGKRLQLPGGVDVLRERDALLFVPRSTRREAGS